MLNQIEVSGYVASVMDSIIEFHGARWVGVDLSYSRLRSFRFFNVHIEDCVFGGADCTDWRMWDSHVRDSSFQSAKLQGSNLGVPLDQAPALPSWNRVNFDGADLRDAALTSALMADCSFRGTKLDRATFENVSLTDCIFTGAVTRMTILGYPISQKDRERCRPMTRVDFSAARFDDVTLDGCRFDDVRLPEEQRFLLTHAITRLAPRALGLLGDTLDERIARALIERSANPHIPADSVAVFAATGDNDGAFDVIASALQRAEAT